MNAAGRSAHRVRPSRSRRYLPAWTASHQALFVEVPADGARAGRTRRRGAGAQPSSRADLRGVDRVAAVVAGAIRDEGLEAGVDSSPCARRGPGCVRPAARRRAPRRGRRTTCRFVRSLPPPMLYFSPGAPLREHEQDAGAVVLDVEPVAHVAAVAVDRQRLALERVQDHERDQLLGELVRAVVVRAVRDSTGRP